MAGDAVGVAPQGPSIPADLRDYFAGQALAGALANVRVLTGIAANDAIESGSDNPRLQDDALARYTYKVADAMLKAREAK